MGWASDGLCSGSWANPRHLRHTSPVQHLLTCVEKNEMIMVRELDKKDSDTVDVS